MTDENVPLGYVYETTCLVNGKTYIGLRHYSNDRNKSWMFYLGSGKLVKSAVKKYGHKNFSKIKLAEAFDENELQELEWNFIQAEKAKGKAEYNLFMGLGAGGDTFRRLTPERLQQVREKQSIGIKRAQKISGNGNGNFWKKQYQEFYKENSEIVLSEYSELKSVTAVATKLKAPLKWIRRILQENSIEVSSVNELSKEDRAILQNNYSKTSKTLLNKILANGMTALELHDSVLARIDELQIIRHGMSRKALEEHFNVSHQWLNVFLRDHKIPKRSDTVVDCSECKRCAIAKELASLS